MKKKPTLNLFFLVMINVATVLNIRNWQVIAEYGTASLTLLLLSVIIFFIPVALISAELATGWPNRGGIFGWIKQAMGEKMGLLATWLLWISNVVWYPTMLTFTAATFAYVFNPLLSENTFYTLAVVLGTIWATILLNLRGMKATGWITTIGSILGTFIPALLIIGFGIFWFATGRESSLDLTVSGLVPKIQGVGGLVFFIGILLGFAGIEITAVYANEVKNPQKDYPKALFYSGLAIVGVTLLGTLAIGIVTPKGEINIVTASMQAIAYFSTSINMPWLVPLLAILVTIGALGNITAWLVGPNQGLLTALQETKKMPFLAQVNKYNMPRNMMFVQGGIISLLASILLCMPKVSSAFWILTALATQLYLIMYMMLFLSFMILRKRSPDTHRPFQVPGGKAGMWSIGGISLLGAFASILLGFVPPESIETGNIFFYEGFMIFGIVLLASVPLIQRKRSSVD
ncbi:MAG: amino acid permease [Candidatus Algichlamydia australiensis]|nr:amino acid permease [Chlamydiales bacterium]